MTALSSDTHGPVQAAVSPSQRRVARNWAQAYEFVISARVLGWSALIVLVILWQVAATFGSYGPVLSSPAAILAQWWREVSTGTLLPDLGNTLRLMISGYVLAAIAGAVLGVLMGRIRLIWSVLEPFVELIRPVPISSIVPLLILILGIDDALKVATVFLASLFPVLLSTFAGVRSLPPTMGDTGRTFGLGEWRAVRQIVLPYALPAIFVGLRTALALALIIAVFSEMVAGNSGIGYFIIQSQQTMSVDRLYVGILTLAVLGYMLNFIFLAIERAIIPWHVSIARQ